MIPCVDPQMRCSKQNNICICKDGYKLSQNGLSCVLHQASTTEITCNRDSDCRSLPNSLCNEQEGIFLKQTYIQPVMNIYNYI